MKRTVTGRYVKVTDGRGKPIEGLWNRNGKFYAQLRLKDPETGETKPARKRLDADNVTEAKKALVELLHFRDKGIGPAPKVPFLRDCLLSWLDDYEASNPDSFVTRRSGARYWINAIGSHKIDVIDRAMIQMEITKQQKAEASDNTIRGRLDVLGMVLKQAVIDGMISKYPLAHIKRPAKNYKQRTLPALADVERFADAHDDVPAYGMSGRDFTLFLAFSGLRLNEALQTRWEHIDLDNQQVKVGYGYTTKNKGQREVDFNIRLKRHLEDMLTRRLPDSPWLFPGYHGNGADHAKQTPTSWEHAKKSTGLAIDPHDLRHFFISYSVMSGCDWLSIAHWAGHSDASLIAKVYGHLRPDYRRKQAQRITFEPVIFEASKEAA